MNTKAVEAAIHFGSDAFSIESLADGLIHQTFKVNAKTGNPIILQHVNSSVFKDPEVVNKNYRTLSSHLKAKNRLRIPTLIKASSGKDIWKDGDGVHWRAFEYIPDSYTEVQATSSEVVYSAAKCYGEFVYALFDLDTSSLIPTILGFHDLSFRFNQLQLAVSNGNSERIIESKELLEAIDNRTWLLHFFNEMIQNPEFKIRAMHHDCKLSNVLFSKTNGKAICPIDLDTVMPGYYFSDIGDMVRSMVSSADENSPAENVTIRKDIYEAIIAGYQSGVQDCFTETEKKYLHHAGMMMIYMQGMRFLADYLMDDVYYKVSYSKQNFNRAANQITLLKKLEQFLEQEYNYSIG